MGLRELKKEQTRQLIAGTAWRLFADRGFDKVTVAEIARQAQVAEATVFNYFPSKEDLFYSRFEAFSARLADAVRDRDPGEPALAAFRRAADLYGKLGDTVNRVRSRRSAAWLEHWLAPAPPAPADLDTYPGVVTMREVLAELEPLVTADGPAELAKERENTREQLAQMLEELAHPGSEEP